MNFSRLEYHGHKMFFKRSKDLVNNYGLNIRTNNKIC